MNRIKELRERRGFTQEELGRRLNLQKSAISKYEKDRVIPNGETLRKLAKIFNVSVDYLLDNDEDLSPIHYLASDEKWVLDGYRLLNDDAKRLVQGIIFQLSRVP